MDLKQLDKKTLKSIMKEIIAEDVSLFKDVIKEILLEHQVIASEEQKSRRERLEKMISEDFDKYDETFNALA